VDERTAKHCGVSVTTVKKKHEEEQQERNEGRPLHIPQMK
jgi:hypothetical protein